MNAQVTYANVAELKYKVLSWQRQGLQQTATGYGSKLTTRIMVRLQGEQIWRRVYAICYSNVASFYVIVKGQRLFVRDSELGDM